jgi:2-amino-4-hydroxy-6-hydroxymethyldihydropteridine diphosphokinase
VIDAHEAAVALGSNVGDRPAELAAAVEFLRSLADGAAIEASPWIESDPVDCPPGSPGFLNGVVILRFTGTPQELLAACRAFERRRGRDHALARNSPRPIDLDLLFHGMREIATGELTLPHPRMAQRRFVLEPLAALRPDLRLPGHASTIRELLDHLPAGP